MNLPLLRSVKIMIVCKNQSEAHELLEYLSFTEVISESQLAGLLLKLSDIYFSEAISANDHVTCVGVNRL